MDRATYPSLAGQRAYITGGASGIGAALVRAFAGQGAQVAFCDRDKAAGAALKDALNGEGGTVLFDALDVTQTEELQRSVREAGAAMGGLDILVNNVANDARHDPLSVTSDEWQRMMGVNLECAFFAAQAAIPLMQTAGGGAVVMMSSINAVISPRDMPIYATAKAGILGMTRTLSRQYGPDGIRVNAVLPGWVETERQRELWLNPDSEKAWLEGTSLQTLIDPDDIANLVLFLSAHDSRMITGQQVIIDAGWM